MGVTQTDKQPLHLQTPYSKTTRSKGPATLPKLPPHHPLKAELVDDFIHTHHRPGTTSRKAVEAKSAKREYISPPLVKAEPLPSPTGTPFRYGELGWKHPDELDFIANDPSWTDDAIIQYLASNAFSIPPRSSNRRDLFFRAKLSSNKGSKTVVLPLRYRVPLMWVARFQWTSLKLVLTAQEQKMEWEQFKWGILHVSRLCTVLLDSAASAAEGDLETGVGGGIDRKWRCPTFDRALVRYKLRWLLNDPKAIEEFWNIYGEEEFQKDVIVFDWKRWAIKGHKGFQLTEAEIDNGITEEQFMKGLKKVNGRWIWDDNNHPIPSPADSLLLSTVPPLPRKKTTNKPSLPMKPSSNQARPLLPKPVKTESEKCRPFTPPPVPPPIPIIPQPSISLTEKIAADLASLSASYRTLTTEVKALRSDVQALKEENARLRLSSRSAIDFDHDPLGGLELSYPSFDLDGDDRTTTLASQATDETSIPVLPGEQSATTATLRDQNMTSDGTAPTILTSQTVPKVSAPPKMPKSASAVRVNGKVHSGPSKSQRKMHIMDLEPSLGDDDGMW